MDTTPQDRSTQTHAPESTASEHDASRRGRRAPSRLVASLLVRLYRPVVRRAARAALEGRRCDPERPEAGRFLRADVDAFLEDVWARVAGLLQEEDLDQIPTIGNRHNVFLGALTIAACHAMIDRGVERRYAMALFADVGWKVYERMLKIPFFFARIRTRDPQGRMDFVLKALMRFASNRNRVPSVTGKPLLSSALWPPRRVEKAQRS